MIQQETRLKVADNSGAKEVLCININGNSLNLNSNVDDIIGIGSGLSLIVLANDDNLIQVKVADFIDLITDLSTFISTIRDVQVGDKDTMSRAYSRLNTIYKNDDQYNKVGIRFKKPEKRPPSNFVKIKSSSLKSNLFDSKLVVGNIVMHERFGKGIVISIEGKGGDKKAEIKFEKNGVKKLLLRFSKLEIIS